MPPRDFVARGVRHLQSGWKSALAGFLVVAIAAGLGLALIIGVTLKPPILIPTTVSSVANNGGGGSNGPSSLQQAGSSGSVRTASVGTVASSSACTTNLTVRVARNGGSRELVISGNCVLETSGFLVLPAKSLAADEIPYLANNAFAAFDGSAIYDKVAVTGLQVLVFGDGSVLLGQEQYGLHYAATELTPFDANLVGAAIVFSQTPASYLATAVPAPPKSQSPPPPAPVPKGNSSTAVSTPTPTPPPAPTIPRTAADYVVAYAALQKKS